jgi:hypothetical protein
MVREQFKNFATSALNGAITSGSTSIVLTGGSGGNFPSVGNFVIVIDTELILIASRSTDTLTVASGGRGFDGTSAASHNSATTVQLPLCSYNLDHIWANLADTFNPIVPPVQTPLSASGVPTGSADSHDNEMEAQGSWVLNPTSLPSGANFDIGVTTRSHLTFARGTSDTTLYAAYVAFAPGSSTPLTLTCKLSDAINIQQNGNNTVETHFFVSDQSTPTASADAGNAMRIDVQINAAFSGASWTGFRNVRSVKDVTGTGTALTPSVPVSLGMPLYLRINYDGAGKWRTFFGDGITYTLLSEVGSFTFAPQSCGIHFYTPVTSLSHYVLIDFVRVLVGTRLQFWG